MTASRAELFLTGFADLVMEQAMLSKQKREAGEEPLPELVPGHRLLVTEPKPRWKARAWCQCNPKKQWLSGTVDGVKKKAEGHLRKMHRVQQAVDRLALGT